MSIGGLPLVGVPLREPGLEEGGAGGDMEGGEGVWGRKLEKCELELMRAWSGYIDDGRCCRGWSWWLVAVG